MRRVPTLKADKLPRTSIKSESNKLWLLQIDLNKITGYKNAKLCSSVRAFEVIIFLCGRWLGAPAGVPSGMLRRTSLTAERDVTTDNCCVISYFCHRTSFHERSSSHFDTGAIRELPKSKVTGI